jgi:hypothetical protein
MALNAQILVSILAHESSGDGIAQTLRATPATYALALTDGTGANQAQLVWSSSETVGGNSSSEYDLTDLGDDRGSIAFAAVKLIYVRSDETLAFGPAVADSWSTGPVSAGGTVSLPKGGVLLLVNPTAPGWAVSSATSQFISLFNASGQAATYDIVLIGEGTVT